MQLSLSQNCVAVGRINQETGTPREAFPRGNREPVHFFPPHSIRETKQLLRLPSFLSRGHNVAVKTLDPFFLSYTS